MAYGRVDVRVRESTGKARLRFYGVAEDQLENILYGLEVARQASGTEFDSVALDGIITHFLTTFDVKAAKGGDIT